MLNRLSAYAQAFGHVAKRGSGDDHYDEYVMEFQRNITGLVVKETLMSRGEDTLRGRREKMRCCSSLMRMGWMKMGLIGLDSEGVLVVVIIQSPTSKGLNRMKYSISSHCKLQSMCVKVLMYEVPEISIQCQVTTQTNIPVADWLILSCRCSVLQQFSVQPHEVYLLTDLVST